MTGEWILERQNEYKRAAVEYN